MSSSRTFHFAKRVFGAGELAQGLKEFATKLGLPATSRTFTVRRFLADGTTNDTDDLTADELEEVCDPSETPVQFSAIVYWVTDAFMSVSLVTTAPIRSMWKHRSRA